MAKNLIIVESPAKSKTIKKFLGSNYMVVASNGHVRDLPKSQMGVDFENDFEPKYITIRGKGELLATLRKEVKKADKVYLATDPDREGEAISWHLLHALKLDPKKTRRITFNEITKNAVRQAIKQSREIDMDLVDAQQARRVLDRMVGYSISPLLWQKVKRGLSAGRVQSVALRIIADREAEIDAFIPSEYWSLEASFAVKGSKKPLIAKYYGNPKKQENISKEEMDRIVSALKGAEYVVSDIKKGERTKKPPVPFTTSTLQQECSKNLNFATQKTMRVAQQLYEGVAVKGRGTIGLITYLRTDSTRISDEADRECRAFIRDHYGEENIGTANKSKKEDKKIQDAHEAIRPTYVDLTPAMVKDSLSREQFRLYQIIWKRFVASRMEGAKYETTSVKIDAGEYRFTSSGSKIVFPGFLSVYQNEEDKADNNAVLHKVNEGTVFHDAVLEAEQHFTQPPAHYTEASLVKALEELGIGRPSTYAPTITTLIARRYVAKEQKNLYLSELGDIVNQIMTSAFSSIVDVNFTATMEMLLDGVAEGSVEWKNIIRNFYPDLEKAVSHAEQALEKIEIEDEVTDTICENCGRNMVIKYGPHGKFLACPGFPDCRNTKPYFEKIGVTCNKCGGEIVIKKTQKGRRYYGCENYPECDVMTWQRPSDQCCPKCGNMLLEKGNKLVCADTSCGFKKEKEPVAMEEKK
ncbi:MAG: type I DNA topoisomerase [Eubacterium sp.]|jgi:DNA topoisomerase-1|nr:type I DNA topoisomerase [Eubacterium sp.]